MAVPSTENTAVYLELYCIGRLYKGMDYKLQYFPNIFSYKVANNFHPFCSGMLLISMSVSTMPRVHDHSESYFLILSPTAGLMVNHG